MPLSPASVNAASTARSSTHKAFMDECTAAYSFNGHALLRLHESLKDAIDPNGILSAGDHGI